MNEVLTVEQADGIAVVRLNRPKAMNALSRELRRELVGAFDRLSKDDGVGVVILTGEGRAFSAGLDLKELGAGGLAPGTGDAASVDIVAAIERCPKPVIAAVNGFAVTGGFELVLACDVIIASTEARFADTHARVGILPGWGLSQKLPRLIGVYRAKELSFTGNYLSAEKAEEWGLVNRVVEPAALLPTCRALAADMLSAHPESVRGYKAMIDRGFAETLAEGLRVERKLGAAHARSVSAKDIASRREAIQKRGRTQSQA